MVAVFLAQHGTAAGRENHVAGRGGQLGQQLGLAVAEGLFALFLEILADRGAKHFFQSLVQIDEGHVQTARELASYRGFSGAGHADQRAALAHDEKGILSLSDGPSL